MDQVLADILGTVPIAVAILIVWWRMDSSRNALEEKRENNRASEEKTSADLMRDLIALQANALQEQKVSNQRLEEYAAAVRSLAASVKMLEEAGQQRYQEALDAMSPVLLDSARARENTEGLREAISRLEEGQRSVLAGLERLLGVVATHGQADDRVLEQVENLAGQVGSMNETINELRTELVEAIRRSA